MPGRPTIWMIVGQGPPALAEVAGGRCLDIFTLIYPFSPLSPSLWETAQNRLKNCLKGPLNPKQPTNQIESVTNRQATRNVPVIAAVAGCLSESGKNKAAKREERAPPFICSVEDKVGL